MSTTNGEDPNAAAFEILVELDSEDDEDEDGDVSLPLELSFFLSSTKAGPRLDSSTRHLLALGGVHDTNTFVTYSQQPYHDMLLSARSQDLRDLSVSGLATIKLYGNYVRNHDLLDPEHASSFPGVDAGAYAVYYRSQRRGARLDAQEALDLEIASRVQAVTTRRQRMSSLSSQLAHLRVVTPTPRDQSHIAASNGRPGSSASTGGDSCHTNGRDVEMDPDPDTDPVKLFTGT